MPPSSTARSRGRRDRPTLLPFAAILALAFGLRGASAEEEVQPPAWEYRVALDLGLATMRVHACFHGFPPKRLVLGEAAGDAFVRIPAAPGAEPAYRHSDEGWLPTEAASDECLDYEVDLEGLLDGVQGIRGHGAARVGKDVLVDVGLWLLRPGLVPPGTRASVAFDLPAGLSVSVPWRRLDRPAEVRPTTDEPERRTEEYALDETTFAFLGQSAFGRFETSRIDVGGSAFETVVLDAPTRATRPGIDRWIATAGGAVAQVFGGRFPASHVQVVVRPVPGGGGDPVPFGRAVQGGGAAVLLLLSNDASDASLPGEWVAVHEMTHLGMPVIAFDDAWFSEGFVTYYQEVLRSRAGAQTALEAWQQVESGFGRGRRTGGERTLADESRRMRETHAFYRVYWAGAAIALLADVELRRSSAGTHCLDDVMRFLASVRGGPARSFSAAELIAEADRRLGRPVLASLAARWLEAKEFPDVADAYRWLGLSVANGRVSFAGGATGAAARDAIMARSPK